MEDKKEFQQTIVEMPNINGKATEEEFLNLLRLVSPGTQFRASLEGIVRIGKGALIVIENDFTSNLIDGGFKISCKFTPQRMMELSKMDGAIIISKDMKRILQANTLLTPESKIPTNETGTRHKAAERTAKVAGTLVVAVSERRHEISVYYKNKRHHLVESGELLRKGDATIQLLEKQRGLFDQHVSRLDKAELQNYHDLQQALDVIQRGCSIQKIAEDMQRLFIELGKEGSLMKVRLKEILSGVSEETDLVIKDYTRLDLKKSKTLLETLSYEELLDRENLRKSLAHEKDSQNKQIRGWRVLKKTSLEDQEIAKLIKESGSLGRAINSKMSIYETLLGLEKANKFKEEIERIKLSQFS
ncbi:MAG: DNA integrity scanning diadenylate cyclase DisA [Nanoarchaeota archaeon]